MTPLPAPPPAAVAQPPAKPAPPKVAVAPKPAPPPQPARVNVPAGKSTSPGKLSNINAKLFTAVAKGKPGNIRNIIRQGANINAAGPDGMTPLMVAVQKGRIKNITYLLKAGANPNLRNKNQETALTLARQYKKKKARKRMVKLIRKAGGVEPPSAGKLSRIDAKLFKAARIGKTANIKKFLRRGANVNAVRSDGMTPLMVAVRKGRIKSLRFLLNKGADPNMRNKKNQTALAQARVSKVKKARKRMIKLIIAKGGKE